MPYLLLAAAIVVEVTMTSLLPRTDGFRNIPLSGVVLAGYGLSFFLLAQVVRWMPTYIAYAVWSGAGTALVTVIAVLYRGEPATAIKVAGVVLIVVGVVLVNVSSRDS